jgi:hypothetical protein
MLMATAPPMTPPATATVDWTALLLKAGTVFNAGSGEVVSVASAAALPVARCGDSMVVSSGVAAGLSGRRGGLVSAVATPDEVATVSAA